MLVNKSKTSFLGRIILCKEMHYDMPMEEKKREHAISTRDKRRGVTAAARKCAEPSNPETEAAPPPANRSKFLKKPTVLPKWRKPPQADA